MAIRIAALSDVHGNLLALEAVRKAIKREKPDVVLVAGDLVMNGPEPGATVDAIRDMEREGAIVVQGNTDIAVADGDYAAAFPWYFDSGVPESMKAAATWAHDALEDEQLARIMRAGGEPQSWVDRMVNEANRRGGLDNITAIVIRIDSVDSDTGEHPVVNAAAGVPM